MTRVEGPMEIPLTQGMTALVDPKFYQWASQYNWRFIPRSDGTVGYAGRTSFSSEGGTRRTIYLHRALKDEPKGLEVDHKNGYGLDNTWNNLRVSTRLENSRNRGTIGGRELKGVRKIGVKFRATITDNKVAVNLGTWNTVIEAAQAYDRSALVLFGEYARLNFPTGHPYFVGESTDVSGKQTEEDRHPEVPG